MMHLKEVSILSLCLLTAVLGSPVADVLDASQQLEWNSWKSTYGKTYSHLTEERSKSLVWLKNKKFIDDHNALGEEASYSLAMNEFGDMTDEEWHNTFLGSLQEPNITAIAPKVFKALSEDFPASLDWRNRDVVTPVKIQESCNSSYAFSAIAALEGASAMESGKSVPFSEQNVLDCTVPYGNHGCNGGSVFSTYQYILSVGGIDMAINYPYKGKQGQCLFDDSKSVAGISGMVRIKSGSESDLLAAVATVGPVAVNVDASSNTFRFYNEGVLDTVYCSSTSLNHAMAVIGYGTRKGKKYWIVKNSWGKSWGDGGYIKMARDHYNQCGIASNAVYPTL